MVSRGTHRCGAGRDQEPVVSTQVLSHTQAEVIKLQLTLLALDLKGLGYFYIHIKQDRVQFKYKKRERVCSHALSCPLQFYQGHIPGNRRADVSFLISAGDPFLAGL